MAVTKQAGLAMVIVLWVISLLTIMAGSFALTMRREVTVISAVKDNAVLSALAETGVTLAQQMLFINDQDKRWVADGRIYQLNYQDTDIRVRLFSESGKININKADEALLTKMMESTELEMDEQQALVSAILDWRDSDDLIHLNGAEKDEYENAGLAYQPSNNEFQRVDELRMVLGMSNEIYQQIQPLVTVYSNQAEVDLDVASKEVIQAIGNIEPEMLDDFIQQRTDNVAGTASGGNEQSAYTIISQAKLNDDIIAGIKVTFKKANKEDGESPFQIVSWQQAEQKQSLFNDDMTQLLVTEDEPENRY